MYHARPAHWRLKFLKLTQLAKQTTPRLRLSSEPASSHDRYLDQRHQRTARSTAITPIRDIGRSSLVRLAAQGPDPRRPARGSSRLDGWFSILADSSDHSQASHSVSADERSFRLYVCRSRLGQGSNAVDRIRISVS